MSVTGRVVTDVLLFDRDGALGINVVSLKGSLDVGGAGEIVASVVAFAEADQTIYLDANSFGYRNAAGSIPQFSQVNQVFFQWTGDNYATLSHELGTLASSGGLVTSSISDGTSMTLYTGGGSGTYTIVAIGG